MHKTEVHCIALHCFLCLPALYFDGLVLWSPELVIRTKDFAINIFLLCGFACLSLLLLLRAPRASEPNLSGTNASQGWKAVVAKASSNIAIFNAYIRASCMFLCVFFPLLGGNTLHLILHIAAFHPWANILLKRLAFPAMER